MEYDTTGTLPEASIRYLINQARWADKLDQVALKMRNAADNYIALLEKENERLEGELSTANAEIHILRTSIKTLLPEEA